jgi:6-phosphogluconolactonase
MNQTIVYVSCAESREIQVFSLDEAKGSVTLLQSLASEHIPLPMRASPDRRLLYVGTRGAHTLGAYAIDAASGKLALRGATPAPGGATYVSCDAAMKVAFVASYGGNSLSVFPLADGVPQAASEILNELPKCHCALVDHSNTWLLVPMLGIDAIGIYRLESDGRLTPNGQATVRAGSGPRHLVFTGDNRHVHCLNELDGTIDLFAFDAATGQLALEQSLSMLPPGFTGKPWAAELRASPDGRFLYATDRRSSVIAAFAVAAGSGALALVEHTPTETQPRGMAVSSSGRWLVCAGELSGRITVYAIDAASGRLKPQDRHATGADPICVEIVSLS